MWWLIAKILNFFCKKEIFGCYNGIARSGKWKQFKTKLILEQPYCSACNGTENLTVHHKIPFWKDPFKELDKDNCKVICEAKTHNCHLIFGHLLLWKSWNENVDEDCENYRQKIINRP